MSEKTGETPLLMCLLGLMWKCIKQGGILWKNWIFLHLINRGCYDRIAR